MSAGEQPIRAWTRQVPLPVRPHFREELRGIAEGAGAPEETVIRVKGGRTTLIAPPFPCETPVSTDDGLPKMELRVLPSWGLLLAVADSKPRTI